jgi:hypothetical protein
VRRALCAITGLVAVLLTGCRDRSSDQEREDGIALRKVLRTNECSVTDLNGREFAFSERVKLFLEASKTAARQSPLWPTTAQVDELLTPLEGFVKERREVTNALDRISLSTPLPIAIREDSREIMGERIAVDEKWKVRLRQLRSAIVLDNEKLVSDEVQKTSDLFQQYGALQNTVKVEADDIEEQLRLPWWNDQTQPIDDSKADPCGKKK